MSVCKASSKMRFRDTTLPGEQEQEVRLFKVTPEMPFNIISMDSYQKLMKTEDASLSPSDVVNRFKLFPESAFLSISPYYIEKLTRRHVSANVDREIKTPPVCVIGNRLVIDINAESGMYAIEYLGEKLIIEIKEDRKIAVYEIIE